ncbi:CTTNBP2 N-terminal like b [Festucalex cinctus]
MVARLLVLGVGASFDSRLLREKRFSSNLWNCGVLPRGSRECMKEGKMNVEALTRAELLTLLSILEGELEAQEVVIHAFRAQHKEAFIQERYGQYDLSDPFLALQRDSKAAGNQNKLAQTHANLPGQGVGPNPLAVLKLVMAHCKRMQERMMRQLAATESRHRRMIADLAEEKLRQAHESAQSDNFSLILQTERDELLQQLQLERAAVQRLEREQDQAVSQAEESLSQQQQLSSTLSLELQKASSRAQEEAQKVLELRTLLQEETGAVEKLRVLLEEEKSRAAELEAQSKRKLADFTSEHEQLKARLIKEEERSEELRRQLVDLKKRLARTSEPKEGPKEVVKESPTTMIAVSTSVQTEPDGKVIVPVKTSSVLKVNGHHNLKETDPTQDGRGAENGENGAGASLLSPLNPQTVPHSPSSTASSSLSSSPVSSPVLAKHFNSPGFHQSSYQAGVNQRFQAARHKFQTQAELEQQQHGGPLSPRDLSPTTSSSNPPPEHSAAKQLARNTVTQVLSRFTSQQSGVKMVPMSSSPFGTDYRNVAASPTGGRSPSGPLSPGIRSPLTPRSERTHPPPIPPKRPGMSPTPGSPSHSARTSPFPELSGNCSSGQEAATEPDLVLSSSS